MGCKERRSSSVHPSLDHLAAALEGAHRLQHLLAAVEHADAGRAVELVAGANIEVAARSRTSTGRCTAPWLPSTITLMPRAWAISTIC